MPTKKKVTTTKKTATAKVVAPKAAKKAPAAPAAATADLVKKYRTAKGDTGSTDIQIIGVTENIIQLTKHLETHAKDHDSRRGLLMMVGKRRRLLNYLKRQDEGTYTKLIVDLGLRK